MPDGIIPLFNLLKCPGYTGFAIDIDSLNRNWYFQISQFQIYKNLEGVQWKILNVYRRQYFPSPVNFPAGAEHADFIKTEQPERRI